MAFCRNPYRGDQTITRPRHTQYIKPTILLFKWSKTVHTLDGLVTVTGWSFLINYKTELQFRLFSKKQYSASVCNYNQIIFYVIFEALSLKWIQFHTLLTHHDTILEFVTEKCNKKFKNLIGIMRNIEEVRCFVTHWCRIL